MCTWSSTMSTKKKKKVTSHITYCQNLLKVQIQQKGAGSDPSSVLLSLTAIFQVYIGISNSRMWAILLVNEKEMQVDNWFLEACLGCYFYFFFCRWGLLPATGVCQQSEADSGAEGGCLGGGGWLAGADGAAGPLWLSQGHFSKCVCELGLLYIL